MDNFVFVAKFLPSPCVQEVEVEEEEEAAAEKEEDHKAEKHKEE